MAHLDAMQSAGTDAQTPTATFLPVTVRLNGSSDLTLHINVKELRVVLGLPLHNLMAERDFSQLSTTTTTRGYS
jgi:hypothetical protein